MEKEIIEETKVAAEKIKQLIEVTADVAKLKGSVFSLIRVKKFVQDNQKDGQISARLIEDFISETIDKLTDK